MFETYVIPGLIILGQSLLLLVAMLVCVAYIIYADRKIWAAVQLRRGPNVVGPWGLLQLFADCAVSWADGRRTRNTHFLLRCGPPRRWCPMKYP